MATFKFSEKPKYESKMVQLHVHTCTQHSDPLLPVVERVLFNAGDLNSQRSSFS